MIGPQLRKIYDRLQGFMPWPEASQQASSIQRALEIGSRATGKTAVGADKTIPALCSEKIWRTRTRRPCLELRSPADAFADCRDDPGTFLAFTAGSELRPAVVGRMLDEMGSHSRHLEIRHHQGRNHHE